MAPGTCTRYPSTKGRKQQRLKKQIASGAARAPRQRNIPAHHGWLVRHMERQNGRCAYCGIPMLLAPKRKQADRKATLDHVVPQALSGRDTESNTVAACAACNNAKGKMNAQLFRFSAFVRARKAHAATIAPPRSKKALIVKKLRPHRPKRREATRSAAAQARADES